jgi:hypothetical protein
VPIAVQKRRSEHVDRRLAAGFGGIKRRNNLLASFNAMDGKLNPARAQR